MGERMSLKNIQQKIARSWRTQNARCGDPHWAEIEAHDDDVKALDKEIAQHTRQHKGNQHIF